MKRTQISEWTAPRDAFIGKMRALRHTKTKELGLFGKHGFVWLRNDSTCLAVITNVRMARKYLPFARWPVNTDDETLFEFPLSALPEWAKKLKVGRSGERMIGLADAYRNKQEKCK